MNFGVRLQRVLDEIGMSQSELGRRIGATSQSVNGWCQAGILPRKEMLEQLPDITGKPLYLSLIHISEPTRRYAISYAVFCLKKKFF